MNKEAMADSYLEMEGGKAPPSPPQKNTKTANNKTRGFGNQWVAFTQMAMPYFRQQRRAQCLFGIMIFLTLLNSGVRVVFSYLARDFWSALAENRQEDFYEIMKRFLGAMALLAPINVLYRYQRQLLAIHWREWMTERALKLYFSNRVYYGLERRGGRASDGSSSSSSTAENENDGIVLDDDDDDMANNVDNPDQRIAEDVRSFTDSSLTLFLTVLMAVVDLICFSIILFAIMPQLFIAILVFSTVGTLATIIIGRSLVQLNFAKLQKEANFRFSLVRVREHAESIAFLRGEAVEEQSVKSRFRHVITNMHALNAAVRNLDFFTTYYTYLTWILPILVVAPEYFAGAVELGVVQQAAASFSHVLDDLSILITQWESLTEFSAGIDRLYTFLRVAQGLVVDPSSSEKSPLVVLSSSQPRPEKQEGTDHQWVSMEEAHHRFSSQRISLHQVENSQEALTIHNLVLTTPSQNNNNNSTQRNLIQNLSVSVPWGQNLLICGTSGAGKSSLLRAIAGLWTAGSGSIVRLPDKDVYFLPQKPYCATGSLRDQLLYPSTPYLDPNIMGMSDSTAANSQQQHPTSLVTDDQLLEILRTLDMAELPLRAGRGNPIRGLDTTMDWSNILSLGEQQRLAFGRILVNRPRYVILDESTSALDIDSERRMYELLQHMTTSEGARLCYVSVGHRPSLLAHHDTKLTLSGGGNVSVEPIDHSVR